ncbi:hypothetical protein [Microcoleus sp. FACHB-672]|uniref:hypothetical protein n=1 Tax=Microcoleus sp. FACHB-672 TaxID=2692825 RepID=UPI0016840F9F|nr:hypothetical protein [Microcoleus sp. FACHB-672]MBD2042302.1 hypothetical protein [Microcoleus sp. FACHB-672]
MEPMQPPSDQTWDYPCPQCDRPTNKAKPEDEYEWYCECGAVGYATGVVSEVKTEDT